MAQDARHFHHHRTFYLQHYSEVRAGNVWPVGPIQPLSAFTNKLYRNTAIWLTSCFYTTVSGMVTTEPIAPQRLRHLPSDILQKSLAVTALGIRGRRHFIRARRNEWAKTKKTDHLLKNASRKQDSLLVTSAKNGQTH